VRFVVAVVFVVAVLALEAVGLEFLAGLEADGLTGGDGDLLAGARVAPDAALARLDDEDAEAAQLDALAPRQRLLHRVEEGIDGLLGLHLRDAGAFGHTVHDVEFDHCLSPPARAAAAGGPSGFCVRVTTTYVWIIETARDGCQATEVISRQLSVVSFFARRRVNGRAGNGRLRGEKTDS
jgi:hypothetical protein